MATQNTVTKIYRLETVGYNDIHKQFQTLSDDLLKIKKLILDLQGKSLGLKGDDLAKINSQIVEALNVNDQLEKQMEQMSETQDKSISKYFQLSQAYKQAKQNAQDLAAEYGVESEQAKAAAESAANLKQQLTDINNLLKAAPKSSAPVIPINAGASQPQNVQVITNAADLEKQKQLLKETGDEVLEVKTKYEQYTGSLRDNIIAQIDNNNQLAKNRDAQKSIQAVVNAQGSATNEQIDQLAALKQQEQILIETNKQLTITIRNQTQEFIAGVGAVDQMQAQLNQLQQQYEKLTEDQRASPFGQEIKKEIDLLLPQVKALEEEQGKFGRNVGNYQGSAKIIVESLKSVEQEIINLQQKQQGLVDFSKKNPIGFKLTGGQENLNQVTGELDGLKKQFTALNTITSNPQFLNIAAKVGDNRQEVRFFTNQLSELRKEGLDTSDVFQKIEKRLAELTKDTRETRESIKALSSETRSLDLVASGFRTIADSAQLFVGVQTLIGGSNEQIQKSLQTLLAVQNVATGARQLANEATTKGTALNKAYNFVILQTKILTDSNATASAKWMSVLKLGIVGVLISAIVLLIANLDKLEGKQKQLKDGLEGLQGVSDATKEKLKSMGDTVDKVAETSIKNLDDAIANLNAELGRTPNIIDETRAAAKLLEGQINSLNLKIASIPSGADFFEGEAAKGGASADVKDIQKQLDTLNKKQAEYNKLLGEKKQLDKEIAAQTDISRGADLQIDANNRILNNEKSTQTQKIAAVRSSFDERKKIIQAALNTELLQAQNDNIKKDQAQKKANADFTKNDRDLQDQLRKVRDQADQNQTQNAFKGIDTLRDEELAKEKTRLLEQQKNHELSLNEEVNYLNNIEKINLDALDAKIRFLKSQRNLNADELKQLAEFRQQRVEIELKTSDDIQKARDEEFKRQAQLLKSQLEGDIAAIQQRADEIITKPTSTATERANAKSVADNQILQAQETFNQRIDALEKELNANSIENAEVAAKKITDIKKQILQDQLDIANAALSDIASAGEKQRAQFNADYEKLRQNILANDKLTATQRANALDKLAKTNNLSLLASQFAQDTIAFKKIQALYALGLANEEAFLKAQEQMEKSHTAFLEAQRQARLQALALPSSESTQKNLQEQVSKLFGFSEGSAEDALLGKVIADSFNTAQLAMNNYFDAEQARVQQSLDLTLQRIELDKQQAQARAQSQAEIDSIEKQAQSKTRAAQRQAGEQLKKVKKSEARVALATELANIAVSAAANPLNGVTLGAAGVIMYGLLAALALARYALNVSAIDRQQFKYGGLPGESITTTNNNNYYQKQLSFITPKWYAQKFAYGGRPNEVPLKGGEFGGKPHAKGGTKFGFKGRQYEAEVDELAIIRTRNAPKGKRYTVTGTQTEIASAINKVGGGNEFAPGASIQEVKKRTIVERIFNRGGKITEITERKTHASENKNEYYSHLVDHVMRKNRSIVERQDRQSIVHLAMKEISKRRDEVSPQNIEEISAIVTDRMDQERNRIFTMTGSAKQIVTHLSRSAKESFAFGGNPREVPTKGGKFGGQSHEQGGTDFHFKGKTYNAEVEELAIIRTRNADRAKKYSVHGTQMQIASFLNRVGGGIDFASGAKASSKFATGGALGSSLQAPIYVPSTSNNSNNNALISELKTLNEKIDKQSGALATYAKSNDDRVDRIQVQQVTQTVTEAQKKLVKQTSVGTIS